MGVKRFGPVGIIDIGSNSVRFVAYAGSARVPASLFNEKVTAGLGRGLARDGRLEEEAVARALQAIARFKALYREIGVKKMHVVATAAVRDASNGPQFLKKVASLGLKPRLLAGIEEAELAGLGVVSAMPWANGVAADLGGGSLELVGVARGGAGEGISLKLGVLRISESMDRTEIEQLIREGIKGSRLAGAARGHGLYLVGGSFRALAQLDLKASKHPLPIIHQHRLKPDRLKDLEQFISENAPGEIKKLSDLSATRVAALPAACKVLDALIRVLEPRRIVTSAFGLREGILYRDLDEATRNQDPLLAAALDVGEQLGRFGDHGAALDAWIAPLFPHEEQESLRLRLAACLLSDIAWSAHPDYRAERAVDLAIHGNWVGVDARGRAILGRTLCTAFDGDGGFSPGLRSLLADEEEARANGWGKAIRLAQRLSAGTEPVLRRTSISLKSGKVVLKIGPRDRALHAEQVDRRLASLGAALGREVEVVYA